MSRRLMLRNASGGVRLYIFEDGAYGDWLNGEVFRGVEDYTGGSGIAHPYNILTSIQGSILQFSFTQQSKRTAKVNFGILLPSNLSAIKKIGYTATAEMLTRWQDYAYGISELLNANNGGDAYSGLGDKRVEYVNSFIGTQEFEITTPLSTQNYAFFHLTAYNNPSADDPSYLKLSEIWIEV